ncbi:MAG TPA: NUDIX domain-containing protein [Actinomycetota bacterium]|jgi:predicted NUDIX family NTP pyrophosphohydrolase|nr:NUDIX domain-containing protein [Actinomycetota bacterium]
MPKLSAGLLLYRSAQEGLEVLLVHPGGPFWAKRDDGAWSVPKGEYGADEDPLDAARREFREELGTDPPADPAPIPLGELRQPSGKRVTVWAVEGDVDVEAVHSNTFTMTWPPGSDRTGEFPEVDRAGWFELGTARRKILSGQAGFLDRLSETLGAG